MSSIDLSENLLLEVDKIENEAMKVYTFVFNTIYMFQEVCCLYTFKVFKVYCKLFVGKKKMLGNLDNYNSSKIYTYVVSFIL